MVDTSVRSAAGANLPTSAPEPLASDLCWLLARASHALMTELTAALEGSGISPREHSVLATALTGDFTQTELARMVGLDKTTMVVTVDELEAAGLAERRQSSTDRRARVIAVTDAGVQKVKEAEEVLDRVRDEVLATLPESDRTVFLRALGQLARGRLAEPVPCAHPVRRRA
ncbi:MAG: winged helix-turn-helix transcriptional regulator [Solirubrobacterales bacterium]|nr:winged helix-turn-helix transcriptional regulator [Solirubrobacterales bacterium]